ncbi:MAG: right-handed parallel beta-helix repeat-containing protein [Gemmatimonadota bacterium]|nr:right-handed parallel beta-helix repeat-containing protein [Gemmatimonadota bacterium]
MESLESRQMMSVSINSAGWTEVGASGDTRTVYVSSTSGSDSNSGLSADRPVKSLSKGASLVRDNMPDHLLLKAGDSWTENIGWGKSGRSSQEPLLISSYGSGARPMIKAGSRSALDIASGDVDHVAIIGLHLSAHTRDPDASNYSRSTGSYGIRFVAGTDGFLLEDSVVEHFTNNLLFQGYGGPQNNMRIRRNVIADAYGLEGKSQGMYATDVSGLLLEENVFDHNGWNAKVSGASATALSHNAYMAADCDNVVVKGNIFADASSHGLQARAGGQISDNLFLRNPIHMSFGIVNGSAIKPGGVTGNVENNVFMETRSISGKMRGWAIELGNIKSANVRNNVITDDGGNGGAAAFSLGYGANVSNTGSGVGINNLVIEDNVVHKWTQGMTLSGSLRPGGSGYSSLNNLTVRDNEFQKFSWQYHHIVSHWMPANKSEEFWSNNKYYEDASTGEWFGIGGTRTSLDAWKSKLESTAQNANITYSSPDRDIGTYAATIGAGSSMASFLSEARKQGDGNWRTNFTARSVNSYIRAGFGKSGTSTSGGTTTTPPPTTTTPTAPTTTSAPKVVGYSGSGYSVKIKFSENVGPSLTAKDLILKNTTRGNSVYDSLRLSYNSTTNEATWTWPALGKLNSGKWQVTLPDERVVDSVGNKLAGGVDFKFTFTV